MHARSERYITSSTLSRSQIDEEDQYNNSMCKKTIEIALKQSLAYLSTQKVASKTIPTAVNMAAIRRQRELWNQKVAGKIEQL